MFSEDAQSDGEQIEMENLDALNGMDVDGFLDSLEQQDDKKQAEFKRDELTKIDPNDLQRENTSLGAGKFGEVFRGKYKNRLVAIKQFNHDKDFQHEVQTIRYIKSHSNASTYLHILEPVGICQKLLVEEFITLGSGDTLFYADSNKNRRGDLHILDVVDVLMDICQGMICLHQMEVIHHDLSARNTLFMPHINPAEKKFTVKLCDFGEAVIQQTKTDTRQGPYLWLSPEGIRTQAANIRTDVYSFGVLMYELLIGTRPLPGMPPEVTVMEILCLSMRPNVNMYQDLIPLPLLILLQCCWQHIAGYRPENFAMILEKLQSLKKRMVESNTASKGYNTCLKEIVFDAKRSKEMLKDLPQLISLYLSEPNMDEYQKQTKRELVKRIFDVQFHAEHDPKAVEFYINYFPWFEEKNDEQKLKSTQNVLSFSKQFDLKLHLDIDTVQ